MKKRVGKAKSRKIKISFYCMYNKMTKSLKSLKSLKNLKNQKKSIRKNTKNKKSIKKIKKNKHATREKKTRKNKKSKKHTFRKRGGMDLPNEESNDEVSPDTVDEYLKRLPDNATAINLSSCE
jgi:hypothetical protein